MRYRSGEKLLVGGCLLVACSLFWLGCEWDHKGDTFQGTKSCVAYCEADSNCTDPEEPKCYTDPGPKNGLCFECLTNDDCDPGFVCHAGFNECSECSSDSDCASKGAGKTTCHTASGVCGCASDMDCKDVEGRHICLMARPGENPGCACTSDDGCEDGKICVNGVEKWIDYNNNKQVDSGEMFYQGGVCTAIECETNGSCNTLDPGKGKCLNKNVCSPDDGFDCLDEIVQDRAVKASNFCGCDEDSDCENTSRKIFYPYFIFETLPRNACGPLGTCLECTQDSHCQALPGAIPSCWKGSCQCTKDEHCVTAERLPNCIKASSCYPGENDPPLTAEQQAECDEMGGSCGCFEDSECVDKGIGNKCIQGNCKCSAGDVCTATRPDGLIWGCFWD